MVPGCWTAQSRTLDLPPWCPPTLLCSHWVLPLSLVLRNRQRSTWPVFRFITVGPWPLSHLPKKNSQNLRRRRRRVLTVLLPCDLFLPNKKGGSCWEHPVCPALSVPFKWILAEEPHTWMGACAVSSYKSTGMPAGDRFPHPKMKPTPCGYLKPWLRRNLC